MKLQFYLTVRVALRTITCLFSAILIVFTFNINTANAQCPAAPAVTSPVNYCQGQTATALTATGTSLAWGGTSGTVGGTAALTSGVYIDASVSNNKKTNFTTTSTNVTITSVDYYIPAYQSVSGLVMAIFNNAGTIIATSSTTTSQSAGATAVKITCAFNYTIATAGNYSFGASAGSGNIGKDNPSFPITETTGTLNITGVSSSGNRCFNNIVFAIVSSTAPVPSTATVGSTNYYVTQTANGCTSAASTITVVVAATGGSAPTVTSPVTLCMNTTASPLTATGTNLSWGGALGTVGGTTPLSSQMTYVATPSNNKQTNFTTTRSTTINTVDYTILPNQAVSNLVLAIFNSTGTIIATSSTTTNLSPGASGATITNTFNYTISTPGNYSIGVASGTGNIGYDNPGFPLTESSGTINITGVSNAGLRCFNNIVFTINANPTAPTPVTTATGSTNYYVTQTVNGCTSPAATINVIVNPTGGSAPTVVSPVNYCQNSTAAPLTATGSNLLWNGAGTQGSVGGTASFSPQIYLDNTTNNNRKTNFTTTAANISLNSIDYTIPANQAVNGLVLCIYNSAGTVIATSSTSTTQSAGASGVKITNTFNYTIAAAGNYSVGIASGSGNVGYDNPSFPITETTGTINVTGVSSAGYRCFNNIKFTINNSGTAPTPVTTSIGTTNYTVTQTVGGCLSPAATIAVVIGSGAATTISYSGPFCKSVTAAQPVTRSGTSGGTYSSTTGLTIDASTGAITPSTSTAGTYTVTYTMSSGCASTATTTVTITAAPAATIAYTGSPYCTTAGTVSVTRTGDTGGSYTSTTGLVINSSSGDINTGTSTAGTYTVTYTIAAANGCTQFQSTATVIIAAAGTWTGTSNNSWSNAANWACAQVPTGSSNVIIPAGMPNYPTITSTVAVNNISILNGGTVVVNVGTLRIGGTISNAGTFQTADGTIEMTGVASQSIPANAFRDNALQHLIISNASSGGVSLAGALDIFGSLTYSGTGMKLNTNDLLTLKSTATGTATVGIMTGNTITGKVTVERYINAKKAWRLLSVPVNSTQTFKQSWQEGAANAAANPKPGYGIQVPGNTGSWAADGFDVYAAAPCVKRFDPATNAWVGITNTNSTSISAAGGYIAFIRGDRSVSTYNAAANSTVLRTTGTLYTGNQAAITVSSGRFAVIGNPYAAAVDMRNISKPGIKDFFYVWDPNLGSSTSYGGYQTFSYDAGNYSVTPGGGTYGAEGSISNYINSGQAFFVQAMDGGGTLTFTENAKASGNSMRDPAPAVAGPKLKISLSGINADSSTYIIDGSRIDYDDSYNTAVDDLDAIKSMNSSENLSIRSSADLLVVERRHSIMDKDTIYLNLTGTKVSAYRFELNATQLDQPGLTAFLEDNYLHSYTVLDLSGKTSINFDIANIPGSYSADRFRIVFNRQAPLPVTFTSIKATPGNNQVIVDWKVANELNISNYITERSVNGNTFSQVAVTAARSAGESSANYQSVDANPLEGYSFYRVKSIGIDGKTGYTDVVKVFTGKQQQGISIAGGIENANSIHLQFNNMPAGNYTLNLFNNIGQKMVTKKIQYSGGSSMQTINLDKNIEHGVYQLQVVSPANEISSFKLLK